MFSDKDTAFMQHAIMLAQKAQAMQEVPVGAVLVYEGEVVGEGFNQPISLCDPTAHAEVMALRHAATTINNYRLTQTTLYVTLEPCIMCAGALLHARVGRLVYGASDPRAGAISSQLCIPDQPFINHRVAYEGGLLKDECAALLSAFFRARR